MDSPTSSNQADISMRALVSTRDAGVIIGRGGQTIQSIRDATGARLRFSDVHPRAPERLLTVHASSPASMGQTFTLIAQKLHDDPQHQSPPHAPHHQQQQQQQQLLQGDIKLLVPHAWMGAVIGKQGAVIQQIQSECQCRLIASESVLSHSTDRALTISGDPVPIGRAVERVTTLLQPLMMSASHGDGRGGQGSNIPYQPGRRQQPHPNQQGQQGRSMAATASPTTALMGEGGVQSQEISIPNDMVGAIIGRGGAKINEIRVKSGAQIRIADQSAGMERHVTISGTAESIKLALYMIYTRLENEKRKLSQWAAQHQQQMDEAAAAAATASTSGPLDDDVPAK